MIYLHNVDSKWVLSQRKTLPGMRMYIEIGEDDDGGAISLHDLIVAMAAKDASSS